MEATATRNQSVVIVRGKFANEPGVIVWVSRNGKMLDVLLGRTGERVTVRRASVEVYGS